MCVTRGVTVAVACVTNVWALSVLLTRSAWTLFRCQAHESEGERGTETPGSPVKREQGAGLAGIGLAGDVLAQGSTRISCQSS